MPNTVVKTFNYTGGRQTFTMPAGYQRDVTIYAWGGGGGGGGADGNGPGGCGVAGQFIQATLSIAPGSTVEVCVGGGGGRGVSGTRAAGGRGGFSRYNLGGKSYAGGNGGSSGPVGWSGSGGGGGGATLIIVDGTPVYVAAGGGAGGGGSNNRGGGGGWIANISSGASQGQNGQLCTGDGAGGGAGGGGVNGGIGGAQGFDNSAGGIGGYSGSSTAGALLPTGSTPAGNSNPYYTAPVAQGSLTDGGAGKVVMVFQPSTFGGVKVGGEWKGLDSASIKVGGTWRTIENAWVKKNGEWRVLSGFAAPALATTFSLTDFGGPTPELGNTPAAVYANADGGYGGDSSGGESGDGGDGGACFLTTATVTALGLQDNCEELQIARMLRDSKMSGKRDQVAVDLYYKVAPLIVERKSNWDDFYNNVIIPITELSKQNRFEEAVRIYKYETARLVDEYITYEDKDIIEEIFKTAFSDKPLPYAIKYACIKAYFAVKLPISKWKIERGILQKTSNAS